MSQYDVLLFLADAIKLRDKHGEMDQREFNELIGKVATYGYMSNRQLAKMCDGRVSHVTVSRYSEKKSKVWGQVNPADFERIRSVVFSYSMNDINYKEIESLIQNGTSQSMLAKLTGISQSVISRRLNG